ARCPVRPGTDPGAARLETVQATVGRRNPDRAAAITGAGQWHNAGGHGRSRTTAAATGGVIRVPGIVGGAEGRRFGGRLEAELGGAGLAEDDEAGRHQTTH